ncbi:GntR family transcriptional regulator [Niallia taxi]|uniref:GntR family transcriptional regulator n=1 Tax=Niallia taxi TaxID=2499688 RepID=A0A3S2W0P9_9BACI|nr:GntR family transcriptional regulator [Niallia taxi]MCM3218053.1 GntR family transcriptional regulator [Niallia taxi]MDK8643253.1 GntR family transcriptional regulator [Niallia taxi]MED4040153.1 GntR family transcriptional regulator [Niallia taxi]MED4056145.1 GntR family transcriptional regulator [Niallia taxi]MED4120587.1 GntR family transcriptional regulator [Niallia taxi]
MYIKLDPQSDFPIYSQLIHQLMEGILKGDLKEGDMLPSVRSLAADLGINMHTVNKSYHELEKRGIIQIVPKSGAVVRLQQAEKESEHYTRLVRELKPVLLEAMTLGMGKAEINSLVELLVKEYKEE